MSDAETTTERLPDVWATRDYPVLRELARRFDAEPRGVNVGDLEVPGVAAEHIQAALHALRRRGFIDVMASKSVGSRGGQILFINDVAGDVYPMTGLHPGGEDALLALVDTLRQAADQADDPDDRSRLRRAAESLAGVGRNVGTAVATAYLTHQLGA